VIEHLDVVVYPEEGGRRERVEVQEALQAVRGGADGDHEHGRAVAVLLGGVGAVGSVVDVYECVCVYVYV
jgi:hypothetical protein